MTRLTERIRSFFKIKGFSKLKIVQTQIMRKTEIVFFFLCGPVPIEPRTVLRPGDYGPLIFVSVSPRFRLDFPSSSHMFKIKLLKN